MEKTTFEVPTAGLDLGNSVSKVVFAGRVRAEVTTVCVRDYTRRGLRHLESHLTFRQTLDATIESPALAGVTRWLAGEGVYRERHLSDKALRPLRDRPKVANETLFVAGLFALALAAKQQFRFNTRTREAHVRIGMMVASLPFEQWRDTDGHVKPLRRKLKGRHTLQFHDAAKVGDLRLTIEIDDCQVLPEGMPAVYAQAYQADAESVGIVDPDLLRQTTAVIDVGGGTIDYIAFGERLSLNETYSLTYTGGVHDALETAVRALHAEGWQNRFPNVAAVVSAIREGQTVVDGRDGSIDVMGHVRPALLPLANKITAMINELWTKDIRHFLMVGGGARLLAPILQTDHRPRVPTEPEWANAEGNRIFAIMMAEKRAHAAARRRG